MHVQSWYRAGASVSFVVQSNRFLRPVEVLTEAWQIRPSVLCCDVTSDSELDAAFSPSSPLTASGRIDAVLHSLAHAPKAALTADISATSRESFNATMDVSAYSLLAIAQRCSPHMRSGGSITAVTFIGGDRVRRQLALPCC